MSLTLYVGYSKSIQEMRAVSGKRRFSGADCPLGQTGKSEIIAQGSVSCVAKPLYAA